MGSDSDDIVARLRQDALCRQNGLVGRPDGPRRPRMLGVTLAGHGIFRNFDVEWS